MIIIKDNYQTYPRQVTCSYCNSVIELESREKDIERVNEMALSVMHWWRCPCCGHLNALQFPAKINKTAGNTANENREL